MESETLEKDLNLAQSFNLSDLCYKILEQNGGLFEDLKKYDKDYSIDYETFDEYVSKTTGATKFLNLVRKVLERTKFIKCDDFINIFNGNINEICEYEKNGYNLILIMSDFQFEKSNIFFSFYFLYHLKKRGVNIKHIYS